MSQTIDLLGLLHGGQDVGEEVGVEVGDLLWLTAQTGVMWLPAVFERDSFEFLEEWGNEVREKLRAAGVHTTLISADVYDDEDDVRHLKLELQVTFVGPLPIQLDAQGEFYGYDDAGNLLTGEQWEEQFLREHSMRGVFAGTTGRGGPGWGQVVAIAISVAAVYTVTIVYMTVTKATSPEAREPVRQVSEAVKVVSVAAAIIALVYLLSKA